LKFAFVLPLLLFIIAGCVDQVIIPVNKISYICGCKPDIINPADPQYKLYQGNYCGYQEVFLIDVDFNSLSKYSDAKKIELHLYCIEARSSSSTKLLYEPIISKWDNQVTFNKRPSGDSSLTIEVNIPAVNTWQVIDITKFVQSLSKSGKTYYGIMGYSKTEEDSTTAMAVFSSYKLPDNEPKIVVYYK